MGQVYVFNTQDCKTNAFSLYVYAFILCLIPYLELGFAILVFFIFCLCFPCLVRLASYLDDESGTPQDVISKLPCRTFTVSKEVNSIEAPLCSICLAEYEQDQQLRILPCKHEFHTTCIDPWLGNKPSCPLCRASVLNQERGV
jgi:hypothetical protein